MSVVAGTAREMLRDVFIQTKLINILRRIRRSRVGHLKEASRQGRFEAIYKSGVWGDGTAAPASGIGSTVEATKALRETLPTLLDELGVNSLLDLGCGDFTWMQHVPLRQSYVGVDIVPSVIAQNQTKYESDTRTFRVADVVTDPLPDADAVLCREILFHLSLKDVQRVLNNIQASPRKYLIATNHTEIFYNSGIQTGDFHMLNLCISPFNLPKPDFTIDDSAVTKGGIIGVWKIDRLPKPRLKR